MRGAECGVRSVERVERGKCGVWKMCRKFQLSTSTFHSHVEKQCVNNKENEERRKNAMHHCILRCMSPHW